MIDLDNPLYRAQRHYEINWAEGQMRASGQNTYSSTTAAEKKEKMEIRKIGKCWWILFSQKISKIAFSNQEQTEQLRRNGEEYLCDPNNTKSAVRLLVQIAQGKFSTRLAQAADIQDIWEEKHIFPHLLIME